MLIKIGLFLAALLVIGLSDVLPAIRHKRKDMLWVIGVLILVASGLQGGQLMGWPSPIEGLHAWISPLGRIIWKN